MIYVFGHQNPDSDSICSALITADWLNAIRRTAKPFRLGNINSETAYILKQADTKSPELLQENLNDKTVWLVDYSDIEQGPSSLLQSNIIGLIDHHRLGTVMTQNPPDVWIRSVGCTCTVLWKMLTTEYQFTISRSQAILMIGAIVSDTVALTSPTTTEHDISAINHLIPISQIDYDTFVKGLLAAKTDLSGKTPSELLMKDAKYYQLDDISVFFSQIEVSSINDVHLLLPDLLTALSAEKQSNHCDICVMAITDICLKNTTLYFSDNKYLKHTNVYLPDVISRKKEMLPWLANEIKHSKG